MDQTSLSPVKFPEFPLEPRLLQALVQVGFEYCTPIQAACLPLLLDKKDVAGQAQTGTGKTAAFLLAIMHQLLTSGKTTRAGAPRAIVISPTRELAIQIHKDAQTLIPFTPLTTALVYGGVDYQKQQDRFEQPVDILIGTPGRLIDYYRQKSYHLNAIEAVVLDEADRMFDLGFIKDIRFLLRRCPKPEERLGMLFSATLSYRVMELAYEHMNNPQFIKINPEKVTADKVRQELYHVGKDEKIPLLLGLLKHTDPTRTIIFVNTKRTAEKVNAYLIGNGYKAAILSGDVPQTKRQRLFREFSEGELDLLVATDLAARGLHIPDVSHVFNFDMPQNAEDYVHRVGRTARAGASGIAVSFACEEFVYSLIEIEELLGQKIPTLQVTGDLLVTPEPPAKIKSDRKPPRRRSGHESKRRHHHKSTSR